MRQLGASDHKAVRIAGHLGWEPCGVRPGADQHEKRLGRHGRDAAGGVVSDRQRFEATLASAVDQTTPQQDLDVRPAAISSTRYLDMLFSSLSPRTTSVTSAAHFARWSAACAAAPPERAGCPSRRAIDRARPAGTPRSP